MDWVGGFIDAFIIILTGKVIFIDVICINAVLHSNDIDVIPKVFSTISSILVLIFIVYRPMERLMPYARNIVNAALGL